MTEVTPDESRPPSIRKGDPCTIKNCTKPIVGRGWCSMHYARWKTHGDPEHEVRRYEPQPDACTIDGCDRPPHGLSLCTLHYDRYTAHGETTDPRQRRFWAQVDRRGPGECWPWTGWCQSNGYGLYGKTGNGTRLAHRIAYQYVIGPVPNGLVLDHLCHTADPACADTDQCPHRRCCNPEHLEPVTRRENIARGRGGDSWGYVQPVIPARSKTEKPTVCVKCGRPDKPVYKSGKCRPCYKKWLKDPSVERPSQRTPEQRFWVKVSKTGRCWLWTASINPKTGYGQFFPRHGRGMDAHRFSYLLAYGSIPENHDVHHTCHVRHCVNPAHLQAVTRAENTAMRKYRRTA